MLCQQSQRVVPGGVPGRKGSVAKRVTASELLALSCCCHMLAICFHMLPYVATFLYFYKTIFFFRYLHYLAL